MEKTLRMSLLFDFYGPLLTERQQEIFQMYFHEDLSLGEIGEQLDVSRQAIYDILRRAGKTLEDLESKLGLIAKHQKRQILYNDLFALMDSVLKGEGELEELLAKMEVKIRQAQATS